MKAQQGHPVLRIAVYMNKKWSPGSFKNFHHAEHDACGIVAAIEKQNMPTKANIDHCINALIKMNHRAGFINGEGDGAGIHMDIPRDLWKAKLASAGMNPLIPERDDFIVGHFFIDKKADAELVKKEISVLFSDSGLTMLYESDKAANSEALGPIARQEEPLFWQLSLIPNKPVENLEKLLFSLTIKMEENHSVHVVSLSRFHAIYKVMGAGDTLPNYYPDLADPRVASAMTLGHNRYSTNTLSNFFRVQPFSLLGHNGEINTIAKLREEAGMIGVPLTHGGSDSQDMNRTLEAFITEYGYGLFEAMDIMFPPIIHEIKNYPDHLQDLYACIREAWGHFAQGPAGIVSRCGDEAVFSVDALGLRPLWKLETEATILFSSEPGIIPSSEFTAEPKPLGPGEKMGLKWDRDGFIKIYDYNAYQDEVYNRMNGRIHFAGFSQKLAGEKLDRVLTISGTPKVTNGHYAAFGWDREHIQLLEQMAEKGVEPIRSLGHDAPLAALNPQRKNIADFIKESVAVVTNPAIDRDRETEHFSTRIFLGKRPAFYGQQNTGFTLELTSPILAEGKAGAALSAENLHPSFEEVAQAFRKDRLVHILSSVCSEAETLPSALQRLKEEAIDAVEKGSTLLIINDDEAHQNGNLWIDPHLITSAIDQGLIEAGQRRNCSVILRSGALRSLHDIITAIGLGADAVSPYLMFATVMDEGHSYSGQLLFSTLNKGLEKVISTIGIHELRGYGRLFSSIGLNEEIAVCLNIVNFLGPTESGYSWEALKKDAVERMADFEDESARPGKTFHLFPRIWKAISEVAKTGSYDEYRDKLAEMEGQNPTSIRHLASLKKAAEPVPPEKVDISVGSHSLPFVIASMSFGSQNETAFRAYAEGAERLNMISMNGEGGEIKDMLGKYPRTRGQQIASGRFGVNAELLNSSNLLEIKIGQGAKPGEGGHLPGSKVTAKIAEARNATVGSDLISPSNNHDIYSIEDLAQMIAELKTANDQAKVAVKVPVVPNIGTIAVGIAKAGADIITVSGFDGGTGAARIHALQHVGLPVEIGVKAAHNALLEAGLRGQVEIWADGGIKSAADVLKVMLLGANRIGFGTLAMLAIGCTTCRGCHLDTCHVGIATQIESEAQAKEHGLRRFVPRSFEPAVQGLMNLFTAFGNELKALTGSLGFDNLQDIVGRSDLLEQTYGKELLDLSPMLETLEIGTIVTKDAAVLAEAELLVAAAGMEYLDQHAADLVLSREYSGVTSEQRVLGSRVSCHRVRGKLDGSYKSLPPVKLAYRNGSIPGNGLGSYNSKGIEIQVEGGAQDGLGKTSFGGQIKILKARGKNGRFLNGSAGKGAGYGAQSGLLLIQGNADARAGIRLSGADLIVGGQVTKPIPEQEYGNIGINANIKGFAFEYMTNGRGLVLGDPGPWICAGMTGGVVYLRHQPEMGLTKNALERRIAKGANVKLEHLDENGIRDVQELLGYYLEALTNSGQMEEAQSIQVLLEKPEEHFYQIIPRKEQADPSVSTE